MGNSRARKSNAMITAFGVTQCQAAWAEQLGVLSSTIRVRLKLGWTPEDAVSVQPGVNRYTLDLTEPLTWADLQQNPGKLRAWKARELVPIICTRCHARFDRPKEMVIKAKNNKHGLFCSHVCGAAFASELEYTIQEGVQGRHCIQCQSWKPVSKIGKAKVCTSCRNNQAPNRFHCYRRGARRRGYAWEITLVEFKTFWKQPCWYCDQPIQTIGLDRVDNNQGYTLGNVVACCEACNKAKRIYTRDDFLTLCRRVARKHPGESDGL